MYMSCRPLFLLARSVRFCTTWAGARTVTTPLVLSTVTVLLVAAVGTFGASAANHVIGVVLGLWSQWQVCIGSGSYFG
jgi:hypothetical protein